MGALKHLNHLPPNLKSL